MARTVSIYKTAAFNPFGSFLGSVSRTDIYFSGLDSFDLSPLNIVATGGTVFGVRLSGAGAMMRRRRAMTAPG